MKKKVRLKDLKIDDKNFNKHSEFGMQMLEKSLRKFGGARSIVIDKNNRIIAGNATVEAAADIGLDEVEVIESDGKKIVAVKRIDIDLNTVKGRELALADNMAAKVNIVIDAEMVEAELGEAIANEYALGTKRWEQYEIDDSVDINTPPEMLYNFKLTVIIHEQYKNQRDEIESAISEVLDKKGIKCQIK